MSDESKFWLCINFIVASTLVAIVYFSTSYWKDHNQKVVDLINSGSDPISVMCAMQDDYGNHPTCIILATKDK
tara:strand:- start:59 stop:277 length:219 start_codon:yes stop_codon:yes gene_type:complete